METKTIYVVVGSWYGCGESETWNVVAFENQAEAETHAALAGRRHDEIVKKYNTESKVWHDNYYKHTATKQIRDIPCPVREANEFDGTGYHHDDTEYTVDSLTLWSPQ